MSTLDQALDAIGLGYMPPPQPDTHRHTPEAELYAAVIDQAMRDARNPRRTAEQIRIADAAVEWLTDLDRDDSMLIAYCDALGVDAGSLARWAADSTAHIWCKDGVHILAEYGHCAECHRRAIRVGYQAANARRSAALRGQQCAA